MTIDDLIKKWEDKIGGIGCVRTTEHRDADKLNAFIMGY